SVSCRARAATHDHPVQPTSDHRRHPAGAAVCRAGGRDSRCVRTPPDGRPARRIPAGRSAVCGAPAIILGWSRMNVWADLVDQGPAVAALVEAARSASGTGPAGVMTHAWLFTGPPGSGRSVAARAFAAALQCSDPEAGPGCGACSGCRTTLGGTHPDVRQ